MKWRKIANWNTSKDSLHKAQSCLPTIPLKEEKDWVTDEVCATSRKKQDLWMKWSKSPDNSHPMSFKEQYMRLKDLSRKCADKARDECWEAKAVEAEEMHERAVKNGSGGSLVRDLKLLKNKQNLKTNEALLSSNQTLLTSTTDMLDHWHGYFSQLSNVSTTIVGTIASSVAQLNPVVHHDDDVESHTRCPDEEEIKSAVKMMKTTKLQVQITSVLSY